MVKRLETVPYNILLNFLKNIFFLSRICVLINHIPLFSIRRYFVLKNSKLFFCKSEYTVPHGMIDLSTCMTVKSAELKAGKKNAIEVSTADTVYYMFADTEKEKVYKIF
jgi:hypothetical protein